MRLWILLLALTLTIARPGLAEEKTIYGGQPIADAGVTLGSWGSGSAEQSTSRVLVGTASIKITTEGWFEGGSIEFASPVTVFAGAPGASEYLVFTVAPTMQMEIPGSAQDTGPFGGSKTSGSYDFGAEQVSAPKVKAVRVVLVNGQGKRMEFKEPLTPTGDPTWWRAAIPLAKLKGASEEYSLKRLLLFGDVADTMYLGSVKVIEDNEPLQADLSEDQSLAVGDSAVLNSNATGGVSAVKCAWDFDDQDGVQEDAVGQIVRHVYNTGGDYTVTLTVTDVNGVKLPIQKTVKVHIE